MVSEPRSEAAQYQSQATQYWPQQQQQYGAPPSSGIDEVRTLWIGDLQYWMDENYLKTCFYQTGELLSAKVIRNKQTGQSEGYGFLEFRTRATADNILQIYNGTTMPNAEQTYRLKWATHGEKWGNFGIENGYSQEDSWDGKRKYGGEVQFAFCRGEHNGRWVRNQGYGNGVHGGADGYGNLGQTPTSYDFRGYKYGGFNNQFAAGINSLQFASNADPLQIPAQENGIGGTSNGGFEFSFNRSKIGLMPLDHNSASTGAMNPGRYDLHQEWESNSVFEGYGGVHDSNFRDGGSYDDRRFVDERFPRDDVYTRSTYHRDMWERDNYPPPPSSVDMWPQTRRRSYEEEYSFERDYRRHEKPPARYEGRDREDYGHDDYDYRSRGSHGSREDSRERDCDYRRQGYDSDYDGLLVDGKNLFFEYSKPIGQASGSRVMDDAGGYNLSGDAAAWKPQAHAPSLGVGADDGVGPSGTHDSMPSANQFDHDSSQVMGSSLYKGSHKPSIAYDGARMDLKIIPYSQGTAENPKNLFADLNPVKIKVWRESVVQNFTSEVGKHHFPDNNKVSSRPPAPLIWKNHRAWNEVLKRNENESTGELIVKNKQGANNVNVFPASSLSSIDQFESSRLPEKSILRHQGKVDRPSLHNFKFAPDDCKQHQSSSMEDVSFNAKENELGLVRMVFDPGGKRSDPDRHLSISRAASLKPCKLEDKLGVWGGGNVMYQK